MKTTNLQEQLAAAENEAKQAEAKAANLRAQIKVENNINKPKPIIDTVKTFVDVLKAAKPTKEELAIINYSENSSRLLFTKQSMIIQLIVEVLNEGWTPDWNDESQPKYYPIFDMRDDPGFWFRIFNYSFCSSPFALKSWQLAEYAGKQFAAEYKDFMLHQIK